MKINVVFDGLTHRRSIGGQSIFDATIRLILREIIVGVDGSVVYRAHAGHCVTKAILDTLLLFGCKLIFGKAKPLMHSPSLRIGNLENPPKGFAISKNCEFFAFYIMASSFNRKYHCEEPLLWRRVVPLVLV